MTDQTNQDLLTLIQVRNQRIAELELQNLALNRNQCKGECDAGNEEKTDEEGNEEEEEKAN
jgi:hypothetical protein